MFDYKCLLENMYLEMKNLKKEKKLIESKKRSIDKFVISNKQNITQNLDENITNEQEIHQNNLEENENNDEKYNIKIWNNKYITQVKAVQRNKI